MSFPDQATNPDEIIAQLAKARDLGVTVYIDNDHISAYGPGDDGENVVSVHPHDLMLALLRNFGVQAEPV